MRRQRESTIGGLEVIFVMVALLVGLRGLFLLYHATTVVPDVSRAVVWLLVASAIMPD